MGRNHWMSPEGWQQAADAGVVLNVDLRTAVEQPHRPHDPPHQPQELVRILNTPIEDPETQAYQQLITAEKIPYPNSPKYYPQLLQWYGDNIANVLNVLTEAGGGVVINCSAGRDRTGLISTLVLLSEGADDDTILGLHAASCAGINAWHVVSGRPHPYEYGRNGGEYTTWLGGHLSHLANVLEQFRSESVLEYLAEHGLTNSRSDS